MSPLLLHPGREDVAREYQSLRSGTGLLDLSGLETVRLVGPDAQSFLQGMTTQDLKPLGEGLAQYTAFLSAKGAMVSDARVLKRGEHTLWVDVEASRGKALLEFLSRYLISEEAELSLSAEGAWLGLYGPGALAALALTDWVNPKLGEGREVVVAGLKLPALYWNRLGIFGVELWATQADLERVTLALSALEGVTPVGVEAADMVRVESGVPRFGQDMVESTIPLEARLERAISYTKGCYIGQEVIARATYRGHMNRHLCGLSLGDHAASVGTALFAGEKKVGWLTSVVRSPLRGEFIALGYVHRDHENEGTVLKLEGLSQSATVRALPF